MNKLLKSFVKFGLILCIISTAAQAKTSATEQIPVLKQDEVHQVVAKRVTNFFTQSHYRDFSLDGAFSAKIFDRYFKLLDGNKTIFLQDDVNKFRNRQETIGARTHGWRFKNCIRYLQSFLAKTL